MPFGIAQFSAGEESKAAPPSAPAQSSSSGQITVPDDQVLQEPLRVAADAGATSHALLEAKETQPFEDLLSGSRGAMPERHVQLFRNLQFKWQCYDAYCRVCLGLGLNHILQAMTYYCICHALVENQTPSLGLALVVLFQAATIFVAFLDLAGLQHREIITVQIVSIVPSIVTALEVSFSQRDKLGNLLPQQDYKLSPLSFLCHAMWLELWLRIAWPSGAEDKLAQLPRRFRQVLFLDPFGDALNWDPNQEAHGDARSWFEALNEEDVTSQAAAMHAAHEAACNATTQLTMAQCALRRWQSVPSWCSSATQRKAGSLPWAEKRLGAGRGMWGLFCLVLCSRTLVGSGRRAFSNGSELRAALLEWEFQALNRFRLLAIWGPSSEWDVSAVSNMSGLFEDLASFNEEIQPWNTSRVADMSHMFRNAFSFNQPIDMWDTSAVRDMSHMFHQAFSFNGSIGQWDMSAVQATRYMFKSASRFNQPIGAWITGKIEDMSHMFEGAAHC
eukprot:s26_g19.t1